MRACPVPEFERDETLRRVFQCFTADQLGVAACTQRGSSLYISLLVHVQYCFQDKGEPSGSKLTTV